jgi:S-DNA-T family DNA segregation ATPase FtsK/SpoIIIE
MTTPNQDRPDRFDHDDGHDNGHQHGQQDGQQDGHDPDGGHQLSGQHPDNAPDNSTDSRADSGPDMHADSGSDTAPDTVADSNGDNVSGADDAFVSLVRRGFSDAERAALSATVSDAVSGTPDSDPDTDAAPAWGTADTVPAGHGSDAEPTARPDGENLPDTEVLEGTVLTTGAELAGEDGPPAVELAGPPEPRVWRWAVGWRHKLRRLWTYKRRYARNTALILAEWLVKVVGWWFRGIGRGARDLFNYLDDRQGLDIAHLTAGGLDGKADVVAWLKVRGERHREVKDRRKVARTRVILPVFLVVVAALIGVWVGASDAVKASVLPGLYLAWVVAGCWLVYYGRSYSAPFWPAFREPSPYPPVTADTVTGALLATGISQFKDLVKAGRSPVELVYRDDAAGGKVAEILPVPGVTTEMITAKSLIVAGGMKRPPAMVHISQDPSGVPGHVDVLFLDIDPGTQKPRRFAYLGKPVNVGRACTIGYDPRNRPVQWALPGRNTIATGTPGSGKTAFLLALACLAASDIEGALLALFDFKGMGDYAETEPVAFAYAADPDTMETARKLRDFLLSMTGEVTRRRKVLTQLKSEASDLLDNNAAAVTDRLARTRKYRLQWTLVIIDEVHEALSDPVYGKEIEKLLVVLMKIGRACGIHFVIATQRTDADSVPTSISSLPVVRVAFHQNGQPGNDQILGTGMYKRGIDATAFRRGAEGSKADDRGSCWFIGSESGEPTRTRTTFVLPDVKRIIAHALEARRKAGTLTGAAAGITEQPQVAPAHSALADVRAVYTGDEDALHGDVIYARVNTRHPGRWKSQAALMAALKAESGEATWQTPTGAPTENVDRVRPADAPDVPGERRVRKGVFLKALTTVIAEVQSQHPINRPDTPPAITDGDGEEGAAEAA